MTVLARRYPPTGGPSLPKRVEQRKVIREDTDLPGSLRLEAYERLRELLREDGQTVLEDHR